MEVSSTNEDAELLTSTRTVSCTPEGDCDLNGNYTFETAYDGCPVEVTKAFNRCYVNGSPIPTYYFDDNTLGLTVSPNPFTNQTCFIPASVIEGWIDELIESFMNSNINELPACGSGAGLLTKQIKTNCSRYCSTFGNVGEQNYSLQPCMTIQGCCIETTQWCENAGAANNIGSTRTVAGECSGDPITPCFLANSPTNSNACFSRCN